MALLHSLSEAKGERNMAIKEISQGKSLALRQEEGPPFIIEECEWYITEGGHISGVVFLDRTDKDYGFAVLGPDESGKHRWIAGESSFQSRTEAVSRLGPMMVEYEESGQTVFPQD